jgi:hypothetical protein
VQGSEVTGAVPPAAGKRLELGDFCRVHVQLGWASHAIDSWSCPCAADEVAPSLRGLQQFLGVEVARLTVEQLRAALDPGVRHGRTAADV